MTKLEEKLIELDYNHIRVSDFEYEKHFRKYWYNNYIEIIIYPDGEINSELHSFITTEDELKRTNLTFEVMCRDLDVLKGVLKNE